MAAFSSCFKIRNRPSRARAGDGRRGNFASEFALVSIPFFLLLIGVSELCLMMGAQQMLENVAFNVSRLAKTGYAGPGQTQTETVNQILVTELSSYGALIDTTKVVMSEGDYSTFSSVGAGVPTASGPGNFGAAQQVVVYTITYPWKLFTPLMCSALGSVCKATSDGDIVNLTSTIVVRNEPYS